MADARRRSLNKPNINNRVSLHRIPDNNSSETILIVLLMQTVAHTSVDDMVTLVVGGRDSCQKSNRGRTLKTGGNGMLRYLFNCFLHQFSKSIGHLFFTRSYLLTNLVGSSARNSGLL